MSAKVCLQNGPRLFRQITGTRFASTANQLSNSEIRKKRCELFGREKARQMALITKMEKIQVQYKGIPEDCSLLMNKGVSTPFNCAMHIKELLMERSVLALVNGQPWDMHRPLEEDCELQFVHFKDDDPSLPNKTFWRTCSFILGHVLETAFKDEYHIELCSFPKPDVKSGSFVYDADLKLPEWSPNTVEKTCLSRIGAKLQAEDLRFERLDVDASVAEKIFEDNRFKVQQIPSIASQSRQGSTVTLYRMGEHVDITRGPLMSSTQLLLRFNITAVFPIESPDFGPLQRVQGVATPASLPIHYWAYDRLMERASKYNKAAIPRLMPVEQNSVTETLRS